MKRYSRIFPFIGMAVLVLPVLPVLAANPELPKTEILGKEYYYHEIKKGESIYGIAKQHDWDLDELVRLNPSTASDMKKGTRLYYPTGRVTVVSEVTDETVEQPDSVYEPIEHKVKKGETVYGISKQYNIPLETIYSLYPDSKYGLKTGEILTFPQTASTVDSRYLYYVIKPGDTLQSVAQRYKTTVEDILRANPGVTDTSFRIGDTVRVAVNSNSTRLHTELVEEERLASIDSYKVKKNDTWNSIAKKTGVDVGTLKEANEETPKLEKNDIINIPVIETVQVEKEVAGEEPREMTSDVIQEIYDSIHQVNSDVRQLDEVRIALLLDEPSSKKDIDFSRGMLLALDEMKDAPYKIAFKVIDGRSSTSSVTDDLDQFGPDLLVATADKSFPAFLADYGETNKVEIVNAFDVRNDLYEDNAAMVQLLPPSALFNEQIADRIFEEYGDRKVLFAGVEDENDAISDLLEKRLGEGNVTHLSVASLGEYQLQDDGSYLIYAYPQKKEEVTELLGVVSHLKEASPLCDVTIVGRPSWVTLTDNFRDHFDDADIVVPARCWLDVESDEGKRFVADFTAAYGGEPVRSFPNFAASGYDIAKYFIPAIADNGGDFNRQTALHTSGLQTDFKLERISNWSGFLNPVGYLIKFRPSGFVDKESVK